MKHFTHRTHRRIKLEREGGEGGGGVDSRRFFTNWEEEEEEEEEEGQVTDRFLSLVLT
jgi:hypothetical protein